MFPGVDGFHWAFGHVVFLSIFFVVVLTLVGTTLAAVWRSSRDLKAQRAGQIRWHTEFEELPVQERSCRHEMAGRVETRTCPNAFDCRHCGEYAQFSTLPAKAGDSTFGLDYPEDRLYHRGHTWVREEACGLVTVGLDDLASRLVGEPDSVELPRIGERLEANGTAWRMKKNGSEIRVLAPIDGEVVETGGTSDGWYLRLQAPRETESRRHLLRGAEVSGWLLRELERLQLQLAPAGAGQSLADGGILVHGLMDQLPQSNWDTVLGGTFLES